MYSLIPVYTTNEYVCKAEHTVNALDNKSALVSTVYQLTLMLLLHNLAITKLCKKPEK